MVPDPSYSATSEKSRYAHGSTFQVQIGRENHPVRLTVVVILVASQDIIRSTNGRLDPGRIDLARNSAPVIAGRAAGHRIVLSPDGSSDHLPNQLFGPCALSGNCPHYER